MAEAETPQDADAPKKKSKLPLLIGVVLFLAMGGGGFYAVYSGLILAPAADPSAEAAAAPAAEGHAAPAEGEAAPAKAEGEAAPAEGAAAPEPITEIAFVPVDPVIISLGAAAAGRHLRFASQLEVGKANAEEVAALMPRILDVLNGYLRAVDVAELEDPNALVRLRAQMLRRIQVVTGEGRVRDLLVTEFVLN